MNERETYKKITEKLFAAERGISEIETVLKVLKGIAKEDRIEILPVIEILNSKIAAVAAILRKF